MKILLCSVGKPHENYVKEGIEDFTKRLSKYYPTEWKILPAAKQTVNTQEADVKKTEAQTILNLLQKDDFIVLLDERGKMLPSEGVAKFIEQRGNESTRQIVFIIGGAFGVDDAIFKKANFTWSLSPLVFPHQMVRLMLAEQLYRACTIIRNEKYHHS